MAPSLSLGWRRFPAGSSRRKPRLRCLYALLVPLLLLVVLLWRSLPSRSVVDLDLTALMRDDSAYEGEAYARTPRPSASGDPLDTRYAPFKCLRCPASSSLARHAPLAFVIGTQKGGTTSLNYFLGQNPHVLYDSKEGHVLQKSKVALTGLPGGQICPSKGQMQPVCLRDKLVNRCAILSHYERHRRTARILSLRSWWKGWRAPRSRGALRFIDDSPAYLYYSHVVPQRMLCVEPHAKVIVLLRHPIDRALSEYKMVNRKRKGLYGLEHLHPFADVARAGMAALVEAGLQNASLSPADEYVAWTRFHERHPILNEYALPGSSPVTSAPDIVARGLYDVQLRQWLAVLRDRFGPDRMMDHILIMESETFAKDNQRVYDEVVDFVGLPRHSLGSSAGKARNSAAKLDAGLPAGEQARLNYVPPELRAELESFYRPHLRRLHELLAPLGVEISWAKDT